MGVAVCQTLCNLVLGIWGPEGKQERVRSAADFRGRESEVDEVGHDRLSFEVKKTSTQPTFA